MDILIIVLSVISLITTLIGLYLLGEKSKYGFSVFTISLACQMCIFYFQYDCGEHRPNWFLIIQMLVLIAFNIRNYLKWGRE